MTHRRSASGPLSPPATFLLSVYFGFQGVLYLVAVVYACYRFTRDHPDRISALVPGAVIGFLVGISFLVGAFLLRRENKKGLLWVTLSLLAIASQWILNWETPPGQLLTFFLSLIGVTVSWLALARNDVTNPSIR